MCGLPGIHAGATRVLRTSAPSAICQCHGHHHGPHGSHVDLSHVPPPVTRRSPPLYMSNLGRSPDRPHPKNQINSAARAAPLLETALGRRAGVCESCVSPAGPLLVSISASDVREFIPLGHERNWSLQHLAVSTLFWLADLAAVRGFHPELSNVHTGPTRNHDPGVAVVCSRGLLVSTWKRRCNGQII